MTKRIVLTLSLIPLLIVGLFSFHPSRAQNVGGGVYLAPADKMQTVVSTDYNLRGNGAITVADTGNRITSWGTTPPMIVGGKLVCAGFQTSPTAGYATTDCIVAPYEYRSRFTWEPQGNNSISSVAAHLISKTLMNNLSQIATTDFMHVLMLPDGFKVQFHDGTLNTYTDFEKLEDNLYEHFKPRMACDSVTVCEVNVRHTIESGYDKVYLFLPDGSYREYGGVANTTQAGYIARAWGRYVTQEPFGSTAGDAEARFLSFEAFSYNSSPTILNKPYATPITSARTATKQDANRSPKITFTPSATVTLANATGGTFTLTVTTNAGMTSSSSQTTTGIAYNAAASTVQADLALLSNVGSLGTYGAVVSGANGGPYTITFDPRLLGIQLSASNAALTGTSPTVTATFASQYYRLVNAAELFQIDGILRISSNNSYAYSFNNGSKTAADLVYFEYSSSGTGCTLTQLGHSKQGSIVAAVRMSDDGTALVYLDIQLNSSTTAVPITCELLYANGMRLQSFPTGGVSAGANQATTLTLAPGIVSTGRINAGDGITTKVYAGASSLSSASVDALFNVTPLDGTILIDTTSFKVGIRCGGTWKWSAASS